jgi:hypothetical protein
MPYLTLSEAAIITGKSEKTIRRLCNEPESKQYISRENGKISIDSNYLSQKYSMKITGQNEKKLSGQNRDKKENVHLGKVDIDSSQELQNYQHKIALLEQEVRLKDMLMDEKDQRIEDLQQSLRLLGSASSATEDKTELVTEAIPTKKKWWQF